MNNKKIVAGIILYNPSLQRLYENLNAINSHTVKVLLIDNGSTNISEIIELSEEYPNITIIRNFCNMGVSYALNQIFAYFEPEFPWILTLDQDSVCQKGFFEAYQRTLQSNKTNLGALCPQVVDRSQNRFLIDNIKQKHIEKDQCITSGMLINVEAWKDIGGYDEELFVDLVDFDFCIRLRKNYRIINCTEAVLLHELGEGLYHRKFLFKEIKISPHAPWRYYHMAKGYLYLAKKYKDINWLVNWFKCLLKILLFDNPRKLKLIAFIKGTKDGF